MADALTWARPLRRRCPAYAYLQGGGYRCDRPRDHDGPHASERGMDIPTWREVWTSSSGKVLFDPWDGER